MSLVSTDQPVLCTPVRSTILTIMAIRQCNIMKTEGLLPQWPSALWTRLLSCCWNMSCGLDSKLLPHKAPAMVAERLDIVSSFSMPPHTSAEYEPTSLFEPHTALSHPALSPQFSMPVRNRQHAKISILLATMKEGIQNFLRWSLQAEAQYKQWQGNTLLLLVLQSPTAVWPLTLLWLWAWLATM